jgi:hypothetical protein
MEPVSERQGRTDLSAAQVLIGPIGALNGAGSVQNGRFNGKMIALETLMDIDALPWQADSFSKPGTYFPALRVTSQRQGDAKSLYARVRNLGRVRVVVR